MEISEISEKLDEIKELTLLSAKNVLTFSDAALLTGLSKSHLYRLTCTHSIPYYKPCGKMIYFDRKELEAWMKRNRQPTAEEAEQAAIAYIVRKEGGR